MPTRYTRRRDAFVLISETVSSIAFCILCRHLTPEPRRFTALPSVHDPMWTW
jgi:hypothetical protein